jgi:hypothetical protein
MPSAPSSGRRIFASFFEPEHIEVLLSDANLSLGASKCQHRGVDGFVSQLKDAETRSSIKCTSAGLWAKLRTAADGSRKANMLRIDDLSDAEFMKLQVEYGGSLPICPICTLEDVRHLLLELVAGDAVSDAVQDALAPVLYAVTGALVADRTMAEQGEGSAHLGGDEDYDDDGAPRRPQ